MKVKMRKLLLTIMPVMLALGSYAADMTPAQLATLKADINANFSTEVANGQFTAIAGAYNATANPAFIVWKSSLDASAYRDAITWTEFTARSAGERDMFSFLTGNGEMPLYCAKATTRQAINDAFSGAGGVNSRTALIALCKRSVTRLERLFATGTGSDATPGTLVVEGAVSEDNILNALGN